jgi:hypothetical protein
MVQPRSPLQAARRAKGLTGTQAAQELEALAREIGEPRVVTKETVCDWEAGRGLTLPIALLLCRFYRASPEKLGLIPRFEDPNESEDNQQAVALEAVAYPGSPTSASDRRATDQDHRQPDTEQSPLDDDGSNVDHRVAMSTIAAALGATLLEFTGSLRRSNVGERMLSHIETDAERFAADYPEVAPARLLPPVRQTFDAVRQYLGGKQPIEHRRRLSRAAAQLATVAGMTLFNLGNQQQARWAFRAAEEAAEEAEDGLLGAWVLASECIIPTYSGDPWGVLDLTRRGHQLVDGRRCVVVAKLAALEAKAHASLGNQPAAQDALVQARRAIQTATAQELRPGPFGFTLAKHAFYEGTCYVRLTQPDAALAAARQALDLYQSTKAFMEPTIARIDMATAYAQKGDLDGACHMGNQVASIPPELRTGPIVARASEFLSGLPPRDRALPAVQALRGRLALNPPPDRSGKR